QRRKNAAAPAIERRTLPVVLGPAHRIVVLDGGGLERAPGRRRGGGVGEPADRIPQRRACPTPQGYRGSVVREGPGGRGVAVSLGSNSVERVVGIGHDGAGVVSTAANRRGIPRTQGGGGGVRVSVCPGLRVDGGQLALQRVVGKGARL